MTKLGAVKKGKSIPTLISPKEISGKILRIA
jgi:hypothetical protein